MFLADTASGIFLTDRSKDERFGLAILSNNNSRSAVTLPVGR
ncbi:MAG: hypothetical protein JWM21_2726 [Acidobacteria bacterium]|nr:hypothetical protein [Acidobacteriota bacterium]